MSAKRKLLKSTLKALKHAIADIPSDLIAYHRTLDLDLSKAYDHETVEDFKYHCGFSHEQAAIALDNVLIHENY